MCDLPVTGEVSSRINEYAKLDGDFTDKYGWVWGRVTLYKGLIGIIK